jgi:hypothetical protein
VSTWRPLLALLATTIALGLCFVMLMNVLGVSSPWLGLQTMFFLLALAKVAEPLFLLRMPARLRQIRAWEQNGNTYNSLGVQRFGRFLRNSPFRFFNASVYLTHHKISEDLQRISRQAEAAEASHFWVGLLFTPYIGYIALSGRVIESLLLLLVQIFFNVYPILHLRITRARLLRLLQRRLAQGAPI